MSDREPIYAEEVPPERRESLLSGAARAVVDRRLGGAALVTLEACKPFNFIGSQLMLGLHPIASLFFPRRSEDFRHLALILEDDALYAELIDRIELMEKERRNAGGAHAE